ncbi:unnamed protein product, partial [Didymodactylos carnosus]
RGKDQLLLEGYRYRRDHVDWRCVKDYCTGRVLYNGVRYEMFRGRMCDAPNPEEVQRAIFNEEIRDKARSTHNTPRQVIQDARLKINIEIALCYVLPDKVVEEFTWIKASASDNLD